MTSLAAQPVSRPVGVPVRTAAQRFLRSLNSLGVIVADSVAEARDIDSAHTPAGRSAVLDRR